MDSDYIITAKLKVVGTGLQAATDQETACNICSSTILLHGLPLLRLNSARISYCSNFL